MPRAAVLGRPIGHSLSPRLHRAAYRALGLADWTYDAVECDEAALPAFLDQLDGDWVGLSLTMPLKRIVLSHVDSASELAQRLGAGGTAAAALAALHSLGTPHVTVVVRDPDRACELVRAAARIGIDIRVIS